MKTQEYIINAMAVKPVIDAKREIRDRVDFLKSYAKHSHVKGFVLGISGGQDSTLVGRLCQIASEELRAEGYEASFLAVRLPYGVQHDEDDARIALDFIQPDETVVFNIKETVDSFESTFNAVPAQSPLKDFTKGNAKARIRMMVQYAYASERRMLVAGSDHAAENITGFFTVFGDGAADIMPLFGLNKRQGKDLLKEMNAPARLYEKVPTADLLDGKPGQTDEEELGISYDVIDDYLEGKQVSPKDEEFLINRFLRTDFKRHTPVTLQDTWWKP